MLYQLSIFVTALIAGFMLYYCLTLGQYFNFLLSHQLDTAFSDYYSPFRTSTNVVKFYRLSLLLQFFLALLVLFISPQGTFLVRLLSILPLPIMLILHRFQGFAGIEATLMLGRQLSSSSRAVYLTWNLPLYLIYFFLYAGSAFYQLVQL